MKYQEVSRAQQRSRKTLETSGLPDMSSAAPSKKEPSQIPAIKYQSMRKLDLL